MSLNHPEMKWNHPKVLRSCSKMTQSFQNDLKMSEWIKTCSKWSIISKTTSKILQNDLKRVQNGS